MARKPTHDWSVLLSLLFQRQKQNHSYKNKQFAEDESVPLGSLTRSLTKYRKGEIELADLSLPYQQNDRNDRKDDRNYDRKPKITNSGINRNNKSKHGVTSNCALSDGERARNSDRSQSNAGAKRKGGQYGNRNAVTHGLYAQCLSDEMRVFYEDALGKAGGVDDELALARAKLADAFRQKGEQEHLERVIEQEKIRAASESSPPQILDDEGNVEPSNTVPARFNYGAMQPDSFEDNLGPLGMTIKMRRIDWDAVIDRWMGRIANLESLRQKLLQGHVLSHSERSAIQSTTFNQLAGGTIDAITAGNLLSANAIDIPANLLAQIRYELGDDGDDESSLPKDAVTPQMVEERERQLQLGSKQSAGDFMAQRLLELDALNAEDAQHG
ncbi:hypothetical protein [Photobacterium carnosum]|uniref:hypothetical protein n=1 Tax=Photobacterium carnosum TaxID=2023717 RepID=UPI001E3AB5FA|nr:hypothetical protein [Photobacterium carnosum]